MIPGICESCTKGPQLIQVRHQIAKLFALKWQLQNVSLRILHQSWAPWAATTAVNSGKMAQRKHQPGKEGSWNEKRATYLYMGHGTSACTWAIALPLHLR